MIFKDTDILIVGGGINGLTTSLILSSKGIKSTIIEGKNLSSIKKERIDGRGIALSKGSEEILKQSGLWDNISDYAGFIKKIIVTDNGEKEHLQFKSEDVNEKHMGCIVEMDDLYDIFLSLAQKDPNIIIHDDSLVLQVKNLNHYSILTTNKRTYQAKLIIATDGKNSKIKKLMEIKNLESDYDQIAAVFNIKHEKAHSETAYEIFYPNGPLAVLPTKHKDISSIVWVEKANMASLFEQKQMPIVNEVLKERLFDTHGNIEIVSPLNFYPLFLKISKKYFQDNILFLGDSLHYLHPIAGQGFNLSLRDIAKLADLIKNYVDSGFEPNNLIMFEEFAKSRIADTLSMAMFTDGINRLFSNNSIAIKKLRNFGLDVVSQSSLLTNFFIKQAMGKGNLHV